MVLDGDEQVVVEVVGALFGARDVAAAAEAEGEAEVVDGHRLIRVGLVHILGRRGQVVGDPVHPIVLLDPQAELLDLNLRELLAAEDLARLLHAHLDVVVGVHDAVTAQDLAQVLRDVLEGSGLAEGQRIVLVGQLGPRRGELIHFDVHVLALLEVLRGHTRQVECCGSAERRQKQRQPRLHGERALK